jgi:hypothetical protein
MCFVEIGVGDSCVFVAIGVGDSCVFVGIWVGNSCVFVEIGVGDSCVFVELGLGIHVFCGNWEFLPSKNWGLMCFFNAFFSNFSANENCNGEGFHVEVPKGGILTRATLHHHHRVKSPLYWPFLKILNFLSF